MTTKKPWFSFHRLFYFGVWLKGFTGLLEVIGGMLLWSLNPKILHEVAALFVRHELSEHPENVIVHYIRYIFSGWTLNTQHFGAIYLFINGAINLGLAIGLLRRLRWSYPLAASLLMLFVVYQLHRAQRTQSEGLLWLSLLDLLIVVLIINEYRRNRAL